MRSPDRASRRRATLLAVLGFLLAALAARGGLLSSADPGDVGRYHEFAEQMLDGELPYRDFYMEYPPGAAPLFVAPALLPGDDYNLAFKLLATAAGVGVVVGLGAALALLGAGRRRTAVALGLVAVTPVALGAVVLNRYDVWPVLLVVLAFVALLAARDRLGFGLLAAGAAVKLFPLVLVPLAALHVLRTRGRRALTRALVAFASVFLVLVVPLAALAPGGFGFSVKTQLVRQLQLESLGASLLLAADEVGVYTARIVPGKPGSLDLSGGLPDALGVLTSVLLVGALVLVLAAYARAEESAQLLATGFAAAAVAVVVFSKVVSPQFLIWLVPLVPLVAGRIGRVASGVLLAALVATQVEVVYEHPLRAGEWPVWVLLGRNVLLVALFVVVLAALRARDRST
jgi:MFS family permease